jgi:putative membrane-bound dehydrogenase-like protein
MAQRLHAAVLCTALMLVSVGYAISGAHTEGPTQTPAAQRAPGGIDREYKLETTILGFRGLEGAIDGVRNPTLTALTGETVRITIVNGELMVHDIAIEKLGVKSAQILDRGVSTSVTFVAKASDTYYCTVPGHREAGMQGRLEVSDAPRAEPQGELPEINGRPLDLGFESGTLDNWTAEGDAFSVGRADGGATVTAAPAPTGYGGSYFVTSAQGGSARMGTLTSVPFQVMQPYASFLVSGGAFASTRVELVLADTNTVIFSISGTNHSPLRPAVVDLSAYLRKDIVIRIVDGETGAPTATYLKESPWAHINFDNFRFHESKPAFLNEVTPTETPTLPPMDHVLHAGLSGPEAARAMTVPKGFTVTLAASEPDVVRPIAFTIDDRGRLWVAEAHTYPVRAEEGFGRDRILVFEDTNGDGRLDSRKVFVENLNFVSGIEIGFGGVWVGAAPNLLFIPVQEGGDAPAGPPQVMLDGWGYQDTHEMLNSFTWGPDGWLYGNHGVFTQSNVGKPGASDRERVRLNAAVWRFHPTRHVFEVFAHGTSNPWGLDFNEYGHAFTTACVIEHLFHIIQSARFKRQADLHFNPYTYDDIKTVADHVHWVGRQGPHAGNSRSDAAGGGHAHAGAMIYLGGDSWPREYRDTIFMNNIHGSRMNRDRLTRQGSGYVAGHGPDFLLANDSWSQMINMRYGPDGSVWAIDWYDKNQCHSTNPEIHQKTLGRIYRISHANDRWTRVDLARLSSERLVDLQLHRNDWYVRHARRILQERGPDPAVHARLKRMLRDNPDVTRKLRALWALHATEGLTEQDLLELLRHDSEYVRGWAVQLLAEGGQVSDTALRQFASMAREDPSALVRLYLASALDRIAAPMRWDIVAGLLTRAEDATDQNLPLMVWYGIEPAVPLDMPRALELAAASPLPRLFSFTVKRIAAVGTQEALHVLTDRLSRTDDRARQKELANGILQIVDRH